MIRRLVDRRVDASYYARRAEANVADIEFAEFAAHAMRREAVCFCLGVVGEACDRASKELVEPPPNIPWPQIKSMRNMLFHEYWQIQDLIVYNVARNEALSLADALDEVRIQLQYR